MSRFCSTSPSSPSLLAKLAPRQVLPLLYPHETFIDIRGHTGWRRKIGNDSCMVSDVAGLEAWFISSLVNASSCQKHASRALPSLSFFTHHRADTWTKDRQRYTGPTYRRAQHTDGTFTSPTEDLLEDTLNGGDDILSEPNRTKEELMALVDQYSGESYTDKLPLVELPSLYQPSDGPHLTVSDKIEDEWPPRETPYYTWPADPATKVKIKELEGSLKNYRRDPQEVYELYRKLPAPRVTYLLSKTRHKLLHHLAVVERKDEHSMLRYLSVVDDLKVAAIPLLPSEWNSAQSFVSRYVARPGHLEIESAIEIWREMEHIAGVKSQSTTFNILFDVACKAGKFTLADMIYKEMAERGLEATRYHHVSMIYYYGLRSNGDGARDAYKKMVEAGEIIDTVALNAMISALIRSKEPSAAENIYERMKLAHISNNASKLMPSDFHSRRRITRVLKYMTLTTKFDQRKKEDLQRRSIIAPDITTYKILVNYFAVQAGELDKTSKLLDEMKWFSLPLHGAMFLALFKGFAIHGGMRYTEWTADRLEKVYSSFLEALKEQQQQQQQPEEQESGLYINKWMATWILRAFAKCTEKERLLSVWDEVRSTWQPAEMELDFVVGHLKYLLQERERLIIKDDWILGVA